MISAGEDFLVCRDRMKALMASLFLAPDMIHGEKGSVQPTSAAFAAALRGSPPPEAPVDPPTVLPGVFEAIFAGTGADEGCDCELLPRTRPGVEN